MNIVNTFLLNTLMKHLLKKFSFLLTKQDINLTIRTKQTPRRKVNKEDSRKHQYFLKIQSKFLNQWTTERVLTSLVLVLFHEYNHSPFCMLIFFPTLFFKKIGRIYVKSFSYAYFIQFKTCAIIILNKIIEISFVVWYFPQKVPEK